jgi:hypothetical protein
MGRDRGRGGVEGIQQPLAAVDVLVQLHFVDHRGRQRLQCLTVHAAPPVRPGVHRAQGADHLPVGVAQRSAGVGSEPQIDIGRVVRKRRLFGGVLDV